MLPTNPKEVNLYAWKTDNSKQTEPTPSHTYSTYPDEHVMWFYQKPASCDLPELLKYNYLCHILQFNKTDAVIVGDQSLLYMKNPSYVDKESYL